MQMHRNIQFSGSARYIIRIDGILDESCKDILMNFLIKEPVLTFHSNVTTLDVLIKDQAALSGLLNELYNHHCIILSIQQIENESNVNV